MGIKFTGDPKKAERNLQKHKLSFKTGEQVFGDPFVLIVEDCIDPITGEQRYNAIGRARSQALLVVTFVEIPSGPAPEEIHIISLRKAKIMKKAPMPAKSRKSTKTERIEVTPVAQRKGIKISARTRELYEKRNRALDDDPDARPLPPEKWAHAMRRDEFFRPIKKQTTVRLDADVLAWLKSKGQGHISRVNEILRNAMLAEMKR